MDAKYCNLLREIILNGEDRTDRTGVGTRSIFGYQMRFDLKKGFPAITTKKLAWKGVVSELLWFLEGSDDERRLAEIRYGKPREELIDKKTIWTANADKQGVELGYENSPQHKLLGPIYGVQWRDFFGVDQVKDVLDTIKNNPDSRRIIMSAWNPVETPIMALPPCHLMAQFYVGERGLSCQMYQRSVDSFLGLPFNIASYALLTHIFAQICDLEVADFVWVGGDCHIYSNHMDQVGELFNRSSTKMPTLIMPQFKSLDEVLECSVDDFVLENYNPSLPIKADMAV
jgi:thymidylate synthase